MTARRAARAAVLVALALASVLPAAAQAASWKEIHYPALPEFRVPKPEMYTLKNGMRVFLMEDHELPLISVDALIRTGSVYEPAEKTGLASITGDVQRSGGTKAMTGDQLDEFLADRAASIETGIGSDAGSASMDCLKEKFAEVFPVFAQVLREPALAQDKLDIAKVQANTGIARRNDEIAGITSREFSRLMYGADSPWARVEEYATIAAIQRDDLVTWHARYYHPENVMLGVVGDFDPATMKKAIEKAFGDWPKGTSPVPPPPADGREPAPGVYYVEKTDVNQANVRMGHLGMRITDPDYFAATVLNEVFGGGFASRLFSNVRSKKGLAYNVYGGIGAGYSHLGLFQAGMQTKFASTAQGIDALREEINALLSAPPTDDEMKRAKESILNSFVFNYDSRGKILGQQMRYAYYGLPLDFLETYRANIERGTKDDVARVAKARLHPDKLVVLVVGNGAEFDRPLASLGQVHTIDITIPPPPDATPKVAQTDSGLKEGAALLRKSAQALGGPSLATFRSVRSESTLTLPSVGMSMQQTEILQLPDKMRQVVKTPAGDQVVVINGAKGYGSFMGQVRPLPAAMMQDAGKDMSRNVLMLLRRAADPQTTAVADGSDQVDGTACRIVAVTSAGQESRLCIAEDGRVLRQTFQGTNPMTHAPGQLELVMSDYRDVNGMKVPHKHVLRSDGQDLAVVTVDSFQVDPQLPPDTFEIPASLGAATAPEGEGEAAKP